MSVTDFNFREDQNKHLVNMLQYKDFHQESSTFFLNETCPLIEKGFLMRSSNFSQYFVQLFIHNLPYILESTPAKTLKILKTTFNDDKFSSTLKLSQLYNQIDHENLNEIIEKSFSLIKKASSNVTYFFLLKLLQKLKQIFPHIQNQTSIKRLLSILLNGHIQIFADFEIASTILEIVNQPSLTAPSPKEVISSPENIEMRDILTSAFMSGQIYLIIQRDDIITLSQLYKFAPIQTRDCLEYFNAPKDSLEFVQARAYDVPTLSIVPDFDFISDIVSATLLNYLINEVELDETYSTLLSEKEYIDCARLLSYLSEPVPPSNFMESIVNLEQIMQADLISMNLLEFIRVIQVLFAGIRFFDQSDDSKSHILTLYDCLISSPMHQEKTITFATTVVERMVSDIKSQILLDVESWYQFLLKQEKGHTCGRLDLALFFVNHRGLHPDLQFIMNLSAAALAKGTHWAHRQVPQLYTSVVSIANPLYAYPILKFLVDSLALTKDVTLEGSCSLMKVIYKLFKRPLFRAAACIYNDDILLSIVINDLPETNYLFLKIAELFYVNFCSDEEVYFRYFLPPVEFTVEVIEISERIKNEEQAIESMELADHVLNLLHTNSLTSFLFDREKPTPSYNVSAELRFKMLLSAHQFLS